MKVMLKQNVKTLGKIGDMAEVSDGYARNYLLPKGLALLANEGNMRAFSHAKMLVDHRRKKDLKDAQILAEKLSSISCTIAKKSGEGEKLFGSVTGQDIEKHLLTEGVEIDRSWIQLDEPIKKLGVYSVPVRINAEVTAKLKVWVVEE